MSTQLSRALLIYAAGILLTLISVILMVSVFLDVPLVLERSRREGLLPQPELEA